VPRSRPKLRRTARTQPTIESPGRSDADQPPNQEHADARTSCASRLGRTFSGRIHCVRGPLLGKQFGLKGLCSGSLPGEMHPDVEGLTWLDRHEMVHCVMNPFAPLVSTEPPTVLAEGWAQANMGLAPIDLSVRAWSQAERGKTHSLRELTGPEWYASHHIAVYDQDGPLVHFLLETYGPDRFLELFSTCRQAAFAADC
jgi:hypothetical protein